MPHKYLKLRIGAVAFVDKGAGEGVKVKIIKRHQTSEDNIMTAEQLIAVIKAFQTSKQDGEAGKTLDEALSALSDEDKAIVMAAIAEAAKAEPIKAEDGVSKPDDEEEDDAEKQGEDEDEDMTDKAEKKADPVMKAIQAENIELKKRVTAMEDREETAKFAKIAEGMPYVSGLSSEELTSVLKAANHNLSKINYDKMVKSYETMNKAIEQSSIFDEYGSAGPGPENGTAHAQLQAIAKGLKEKDPELDMEHALNKAMKLNPELYAKASEEDTIMSKRDRD